MYLPIQDAVNRELAASSNSEILDNLLERAVAAHGQDLSRQIQQFDIRQSSMTHFCFSPATRCRSPVTMVGLEKACVVLVCGVIVQQVFFFGLAKSEQAQECASHLPL